MVVPAPAGLKYPKLSFDIDTPEDLSNMELLVKNQLILLKFLLIIIKAIRLLDKLLFQGQMQLKRETLLKKSYGKDCQIKDLNIKKRKLNL